MSGKVTKELLESILPDWEVSSYGDGGFELSSYSPAGENILMSLVGDTLDDMARFAESYYNDFDPQDHAAKIYHAKHYGTADEQRFYASAPEDLKDLIEDAEDIDNMYYSVYLALCEKYKEDSGDGDDSEE